MNKELLNLRWKTLTCFEGESCWCRIIVLEEPVLEDGDEAWVVGTGAISKELAEYIVGLHNKRLEEKEYFKPQLDKYKDIRVIYPSEDNKPCCDETNPCSCNTFSPRMAGPKDMENFKATTQEEYESAWQKIWNKIGIPKKYLGSK